jgi:4-amino-4-deoxy-L-arabinose transferase-like glycosyltransferase
VLAGGLPFLIYLRTLAPTVYGLDSAELSAGAYVLGIVHAPGSPFYLLIGHLFTKLPVGDVGYRMNLLSACAVALALVFTFHLARRLSGRRWVALLSTWQLGFTYYVWIAAVAAELYAVQATFTAVLLWLAWRWEQEGRRWQIVLFAFCTGLGLGVHLSLALLLPGFLLLLWRGKRPWQDVGSWGTAVLAGSLGLLVYLYLPLRYAADPPLNYARIWGVDLTTWRGFWWMVTGRMFSSLFFAVPLTELPGELVTYLFRLWSNFLGLGVIVGMWGLARDWRKRPWFHLSLLLMFSTYVFFYLTYNAGDKELMFLPTYFIWNVWLVIGLTYLKEPVESLSRRLGPILLLLAALGAFALNYSYADVSADRSAREFGEEIFAKLKPDAVYMGTWLDVPILEYLQIVEGQRGDVTLVNHFFTDPPQAEQIVESALAAARPVYTTTRSDLDLDRYTFELLDVCNCYRVVYTQPD